MSHDGHKPVSNTQQPFRNSRLVAHHHHHRRRRGILYCTVGCSCPREQLIYSVGIASFFLSRVCSGRCEEEKDNIARRVSENKRSRDVVMCSVADDGRESSFGEFMMHAREQIFQGIYNTYVSTRKCRRPFFFLALYLSLSLRGR